MKITRRGKIVLAVLIAGLIWWIAGYWWWVGIGSEKANILGWCVGSMTYCVPL